LNVSSDFELDLEKNLEDVPPKLLRKIIRAGLGKRSKKKMSEAECEDDEDCDLTEDEDEAEIERDKLSRAAEEQRGEAPKLAVSRDDLPPGVADRMKKKKS
jgi:hypothetical protein